MHDELPKYHSNEITLSPDEAIKLGKQKREMLGYCMCGSKGKIRTNLLNPPRVICEDCWKASQ